MRLAEQAGGHSGVLRTSWPGQFAALMVSHAQPTSLIRVPHATQDPPAPARLLSQLVGCVVGAAALGMQAFAHEQAMFTLLERAQAMRDIIPPADIIQLVRGNECVRLCSMAAVLAVQHGSSAAWVTPAVPPRQWPSQQGDPAPGGSLCQECQPPARGSVFVFENPMAALSCQVDDLLAHASPSIHLSAVVYLAFVSLNRYYPPSQFTCIPFYPLPAHPSHAQLQAIARMGMRPPAR